MVRFNSTIMNSIFGTTSKSNGSSSSGSSVIITGIALSDSVDGEVLVQIGDPVENVLDEDNDIFIETYLDDEDDDTVDNVDDDVLSEELGEDDDPDDIEEEETPTVYIGDDEESDQGDEIPTDDEFEEVVE